MAEWLDWLASFDWPRLVPEFFGKLLGFLAGFGASWFLLFRKRLNALQKLQKGDSDDLIFQMHKLWPVPGTEKHALLFRNVAPKTTLNSLYDNEAAQRLMKKLADSTTLSDPILKTAGTLGFELLNDAAGHIAGLMATTPFERETWLFMLTCEDRQVVRKQCIRGFLIRQQDLEHFANWSWCTSNVMVESPWHWFRVVALHRIAMAWIEQESVNEEVSQNAMPLVDNQETHPRIKRLSLGLNKDESPIREPIQIDWVEHRIQLNKLGLNLEWQEKVESDA
jgi:hypothetical protein